MPKVDKNGLEKPIDIHLRIVPNGVTLEGSQEDRTLEYVYKSLNEALKEVKSVVSVLKDEEKKPTKEDLDEEEYKINNSQEREE